MIRPTFIALDPGELNYYLLVVRLGKYERRSNATYDPSSKMCVPSKTEDVNVFNIVTGTSEANMLTKHILCGCKCKVDDKKCNSNQYSNNVCQCEFKK